MTGGVLVCRAPGSQFPLPWIGPGNRFSSEGVFLRFPAERPSNPRGIYWLRLFPELRRCEFSGGRHRGRQFDFPPHPGPPESSGDSRNWLLGTTQYHSIIDCSALTA
jgi:hypothetical protein